MASWKGATCEPQPGSAGIAHQPVAAQRERQKEVPIKWGFLAHGADRFSAWPRSHRCANPETFRIWLCPSARRAAKRTGSLSSDAGRRTRTRVRRDAAWEGKNSAERRTGRAHIGLSIDSPTIQNAYSPQAKYKLLVIVLPLPVTVILSGLHPMPGTKMAL